VEREVAHVVRPVEEVVLDHEALVAEAEDEVPEAVVRVVLHDVDQDRHLADLDQRLRNELGLLVQAGSRSAAEDDDGDVREFGVHRAE